MRYSHLTTSAWTTWAYLVPRYFSKHEINTMTNDFSKRLDTVSYREIYRGAMVYTRKVVAVDRVSDEYFNRKLEVLRGLYHDNVVRCVGFCNEDGETILLYDDMPTSTLSDWHEGDKRGVNHKWPARKRILFGVANGIHYLHSVPKLIHRAIHPDDILLNSNLDPKLTGFGWSIFQTDVVSSYDVRGLTYKGLWRAPEYDRGRFNEKVDVYSYGLVLFEIVSGSRVSLRNFKFSSRHHVSFSNKHLEQGWVLLLQGRTKELIDRTLNLGQHEYVEAARMMKIAFLCMHKEPERRPDMSVVLEMMLGNRDAEIESLVFHQN